MEAPEIPPGFSDPCHTLVTLKARKSQHLKTVANTTREAHFKYVREFQWGCTASPLVPS
jgi:hypothetical protein